MEPPNREVFFLPIQAHRIQERHRQQMQLEAIPLSLYIVSLVLVGLLIIKELPTRGRQSRGLHAPVLVQERLPARRRFPYRRTANSRETIHNPYEELSS
jgi:hypothetical protein